ncbi:response regulator [Desulforhopalus sp. 52FAK]
MDIFQYWRRLTIKNKFRLAFGTLIGFLTLVGVSGIVVLNVFQDRAERSNELSAKIQYLVEGMNLNMYKARSLEKDLFLWYPIIGYSAASKKYAEAATHHTNIAEALSIKLQDLVLQSSVSDAWRESIVSLNLFISSVKRHAFTVKQTEKLISSLAADETGLQSQLSKTALLLGEAFNGADARDVTHLFHQMQASEKEYLATRQRPHMQSAFNTAVHLKEAIAHAPSYATEEKAELLKTLAIYLSIAEEIVTIDVAIRGKFKQFDLESEAIAPIIETLFSLANEEIEHTRVHMGNRGRLSIVILLVTAIVGLLLSSIIALILNKSITSNVIRLTKATREFQTGNKEARAAIDSDDELGELGDNFNVMASSIEAHVGDLERKVTERTAQLKTTNKQLSRTTYNLGERLKELHCLYRIEELVRQENATTEEILQSIADLIPSSWQYPDITCGQIKIAEKSYKTDNFKETEWLQTQKIIASGIEVGVVEVYYLEEKPEIDEGPFLGEERKLIGAIAERIGEIIEGKQKEEGRRLLEKQLQQAQKMESIGTLAGGVAHEFNNMLAIIMGNNQLIIEELPEGSLARESTEEIKIAGTRARDVVKQLLTFSRQDDAEKKEMDFTFVVQESMKLIRSSIPVNIKIEQNLSADTYPVMGNDTQINQLLIHLCNNGVDALPEKGGIVTVELSYETIDEVQTKHQQQLKPGLYAKLMVSDNGIGMDKVVLDRVFEPYFTTKDIGEGTGIGMAIVHGIVERHDGAIYVDSTPGQGTTFTIFLPAHEGLIEQENDELDVLPVGDESVLYVDDEASIAKLGKRLLESLGYTAEPISDPEKALDMVRNDPDKFDLLITDMAMPNMTGEQLVIETLKIRQNMPIIICTGYSAKISEKEAADIGARSFIMKPINKSELAKMVRKVLDETKRSDPVMP